MILDLCECIEFMPVLYWFCLCFYLVEEEKYKLLLFSLVFVTTFSKVLNGTKMMFKFSTKR